jgi:hypothetical protein
MTGLICIKVCLNKVEADIIKGLLKANSIDAIISEDTCGGLRPDLAYHTGGIKILVKENDKEKALEILENPADK